MHGFVDVSGMTYEDVRRMGHSDDYEAPTRNPYAYRKPMPRTTKVTVIYNADDVWAAAVQAQAINGVYTKVAITSESDPSLNQKSNRQIVEELLKDTTQITQENRDKGKAVRQYFNGLTFKLLEGKTLNDFSNTAMTIASKDSISGNYDLAVIVSLPATYEKSSKRDDIDRRINFARGGYLGNIGDKVTAEIEIVKQIWSQNWNTYFITGITDADQVLFFAYKNNIEIGDRVTIQGTVKTFRDNSTQLNRVKVIV